MLGLKDPALGPHHAVTPGSPVKHAHLHVALGPGPGHPETTGTKLHLQVIGREEEMLAAQLPRPANDSSSGATREFARTETHGTN